MNIFVRLLPAFALGLLLPGNAEARTVARPPANSWEIGPVINGRNHSLGPSRLSGSRDGWAFTISPTAQPHYVTFIHGSLRGKKLIRMRFRVVGPADAIVHGAKCATGSPSAVTLYFQRADDNWARDGGRWWAPFASAPLNGPMGETEIVAPLHGKWTSVLNMTADNSPNAFTAAKANAGRVGFTFANCEGLGHGARATAPVRFVVTRFEVL